MEEGEFRWVIPMRREFLERIAQVQDPQETDEDVVG
jgi:hypothetical protein